MDTKKNALIANDGGALDFTGREISLGFNSEFEGTRVGNTQQVVFVDNARSIDTSSVMLANSEIGFDKKYTFAHQSGRSLTKPNSRASFNAKFGS